MLFYLMSSHSYDIAIGQSASTNLRGRKFHVMSHSHTCYYGGIPGSSGTGTNNPQRSSAMPPDEIPGPTTQLHVLVEGTCAILPIQVRSSMEVYNRMGDLYSMRDLPKECYARNNGA